MSESKEHGRWTATPPIPPATINTTDPRVAKITVTWKPMVTVTIGSEPFIIKPNLESMVMTGVVFANTDQADSNVLANTGTRKVIQEIIEELGPQGGVRKGVYELLTKIGEQVRDK